METQQRTTSANGAHHHKRKMTLASKAVRSMERSGVPREIARALKTTAGIVRARCKRQGLPRTEWKDREKVLRAVAAAGDVKGAAALYEREYGTGNGTGNNGAGAVSSAVEPSPSTAVATDTAVIAAPASPTQASSSRGARVPFERWHPDAVSRELKTRKQTIHQWITKAGKKSKHCSRRDVLEIASRVRNQVTAQRARKLLAELDARGGEMVVPHEMHGEVLPASGGSYVPAEYVPAELVLQEKRLLYHEVRRGVDWLNENRRPSELDDAHLVLLGLFRGLSGK